MKTCCRCSATKPLDAFHVGRGMCKPCKAADAKSYRDRNVEACKARSRQWYADNREVALANTKAWQEANLEAHRATKKAYRDSRLDETRARWRAWRDANRHVVKALRAQRRAAQKLAVVAWADPAAIRAVYAHAALLSMTTGTPHSVDHIVPLQSPVVCGLHVEHNLRAIPCLENESKGNRWWPDMPDEKPINAARCPRGVSLLAPEAPGPRCSHGRTR